MLKFSRVGGVYYQEEKVDQYLEGLTTTVSIAVSRDRQIFREVFRKLTEVIEL